MGASRRPGVGFARRVDMRGLNTNPPGVVTRHDLSVGGTFTRALPVGYYQSGAESLLSAAANVRRMEYDPSIVGVSNLFEGTRSNFFARSEPVAGWTTTGTTLTMDAASGPLGANTAASAVFTASATANAVSIATSAFTNATNVCISMWLRGAVGGEKCRLCLRQKDGATFVYSSELTLTTTWTRYDAILNVGTGASTVLPGVANAVDATIRTIYLACATLEQPASTVQWPSSWIDVPSTVTVARAADSLSYAVGEYPAAFLSTGFRITCIPGFSSAEQLVASVDATVFSQSATQMLRFGWASGTENRIRAIESGAIRVQSSPCTWSRYQVLTVTIRPSAGTLTLSGFTTGDGTYSGTQFTWPSATVYFGLIGGSVLSPWFGRLGRFVEVPV